MADYVLEIVEGPESGRQIPLTGPVEVGRDPASSVALLQDELVSGHHVRLTPEDDGVRVEDLESKNGTFVDGDEIFGPAHLAPGGQLLLGVTVLELQRAPDAASGRTGVRPIPSTLTSLRPLPAADTMSVTAERRVPTLAVSEAEPDYVPSSALDSGTGDLFPLLDTHTKGKARGAPIGMFVLAALAVILYFALR